MQAQSPAAPFQFLGQWGVQGAEPGQLSDPDGVATDRHGNVFFADPGSDYVDKFDPRGTPLLCFQQDGLKHPQWITVDSGGAIYVTDPSRNTVFIFLPDGKRFRTLRLRTRPSEENLLSVAVYGDGLIYILDSDANKVFVYTPRLRLVRDWPVPGIDRGRKGRSGPIAVSDDGDLYIADAPANRILRLSPQGRSISEIRGDSGGTNRAFSSSFAISGRTLLVMDADGRTVHVLTTDGAAKFDAQLGPELDANARSVPDIAVSPLHDLFVVEASSARVLHYRMDF